MRQLCVSCLWFLLSIFGSLSAQSVDNFPSSTQAELESAFQSKRIGEERLQHFQARAEQKLRDWLGYLELASTSSYPAAMRQQALQAAQRLFSNAPAVIHGALTGNTALEEWQVADFHKQFRKEAKHALRYSVTQLRLAEPLVWQEACACYKGQLQFNLKTTVNLPSTTVQELLYPQVLDFRLEKVRKDFGDESRELWEVRLQALSIRP